MFAEEDCSLYKIMSFLQIVPPGHLGGLVPDYLRWTYWLLTEPVNLMIDLRNKLKIFRHDFHEDPINERLQNEYFQIVQTVRINYYEMKRIFEKNENIIEQIRRYLIYEYGEWYVNRFLAPIECIPKVVSGILENIRNGIRDLNRIRRKQRFILQLHKDVCTRRSLYDDEMMNEWLQWENLGLQKSIS